MCAGSQTFAQTSKSANNSEQIDKLLSKYNSSETPGVAVSVVKDGKIIFKKGYGMANLEYDIPITPSTVFHVASVSKQFTTFSILLLEKDGKISLDDDIRKYVPEVPDFGKKITLRHLATHTSGIRDQWALLTLAGWRMDDVITTQQVLKLINRQKTLNFEPGSKFQYSNSGFTLLAEVVARVTKQTFAEFTKQRIFEPLKMTNTQFYDNHQKIVKNRAYSYGKSGSVYIKGKLNYSNVGPTSLFTTVEDLSKWSMNFEEPIVGNLEIVRKLKEPAKLNDGKLALLAVREGEPIYHAMGQFVRNYRGLDIVNHTGSDAGFKSYLLRFPSEKFSVMLLGNDASFNSFQTGLTIAEFYLKKKLKTKKSAVNRAANPARPINKNNAAKSKVALSEYVGRYKNDELLTEYSLVVKNGQLTMTHLRLDDAELKSVGKDKFTGNIWFGVELEFERRQNGKVEGFRISNFGATNLVFRKVK